MTNNRVSRAAAKAAIDGAAFGVVVVTTVDPIPTLGDVPPEERDADIGVETYWFGTKPGTSERDTR